MVSRLVKLEVYQYAQIIFPIGFAGQGMSVRILQFGYMELDHPQTIKLGEFDKPKIWQTWYIWYFWENDEVCASGACTVKLITAVIYIFS